MGKWRLHHVGFVVGDMDRALDYYRSLGFDTSGPEHHIDFPKKQAEIKVRLVPTGDTEIEFLEPSGGETMQSQFLARHGEGIQHLAFVVDDIEQEVAALVEKGAKLMFNQEVPGKGRYAYFNTGDIGDVRLELIQFIK
jgi:methylmalonyl-CoA/ethylmalonyl-CoA epimerase